MDIQRKWDAELQANRMWSVFLLPRGELYYEPFIPPMLSPYLSKEEVLQHLVNLWYMFDEDLMEVSTEIRLMAQFDHFKSVDTIYRFSLYVEEAMSKIEEIGFKPNAIAKSVKNPYYRFPTHDKKERSKIRHEHRKLLLARSYVDKHGAELYAYLEDYDLNEGLLTKVKIMKDLQISRHILSRLFGGLPETYDMYKTLKEASVTTSHYKNNKK